MNKSIVVAITVTSLILAAVVGLILIFTAGEAMPSAPAESSAQSVSEIQDIGSEEESSSADTTKAPVTTPHATTTTTAESTPAPTVTPVQPEPTGDSRAPVLLPPEPSGKPCTFYDDAAFIGDSVSVMLTYYAESNGLLGDPLFLTKECYGIANAINNNILLEYNGTEMPPEDALAKAGVKKVFIMLGMNDVGYNTDYIMKGWGTVIDRIRAKCPGIKIYVQSCTPVWTGGETDVVNNKNMDRFNARLKEMAAENGCIFVDVAPYFKDSTGGLASKYCSDHYVHLTTEGVSAWTKFLLAYAESAS